MNKDVKKTYLEDKKTIIYFKMMNSTEPEELDQSSTDESIVEESQEQCTIEITKVKNLLLEIEDL
jgi:hypothetical protein